MLPFVAAALLACAADLPSLPARPQHYLTDRTGLLSANAAQQIDAKLEQYAKTTGHQLVVYIDQTTGGIPLEEWSAKTFESWGVGRKGEDDGVALFILTGDRRARIEVGYGFEDELPDALAGRILDETLMPGLKNGNPNGAVSSTVDALLVRMGGGELVGTQRGPGSQQGRSDPLRSVLTILFIGFALYLGIRHPWIAMMFLSNLGGRGGGWGGGGFGDGGGGGFSGGGGRSGGGGASRSW